MAEVPTQPQSQPTKQGINWKNILIGAIIGAVLVGVGVLVFYLYQSSSEETTTTATPKTSTPSAKTATPAAKKDETAGWAIFTNQKFSLKYPNDWYAYDYYKNWDELTVKGGAAEKEKSRNRVVVTTLAHFPDYNEYYNGLYIAYRTDSTVKKLSEFCPAKAHGGSCTVTELTVNGLDGYKVTESLGPEAGIGFVFLNHPDGVGLIDITPQEWSNPTEAEKNTIKKILNTVTAK